MQRIFVGPQIKGILNDRNFYGVLGVVVKHSDWLFTTFRADTKLPTTDSWLKTCSNDGFLCVTENTLGDVSYEHDEKFHQDISAMEKR
jgi:hypothetical protein